MKNSIILFLILVPAFLFAQYPATGNKSRLGYQTTGDGLIWRGVAADTAIKPRTTANAYFQLDTVNRILRRYIATQGSWQVVGGGTNVDSLIYATRYWVGANFFPLVGGTLTGTGGAGFLGLPAQSGTPSTPAAGFRLFANGAHNLAILDRNGWITTFDISAIANRDFTYPSTGGTFALGTGTADRSARWTATNTLAAGNITDNGTKLQALLPWQFQTYTTAGLPSGVTGYTVYNTTTNGPGWYQGSRWAYAWESTSPRFTQGSIIFADANGQAEQDNSRLVWDNTNKMFGIGGAPVAGNGAFQVKSSSALLIEFRSTGSGFVNNRFKSNTGGDWGMGTGYSPVGVNNFFIEDVARGVRLIIDVNGRLGIGLSSTVNYSLEQMSKTDAFGIARGTVAQRPTIVTSTTPIRFNTDSTALEYGESVGTWRQIATRAYARSSDTWLGTRLPAGNVTINALGNEFNLDSLAGRFKIANNKRFYIQKSESGFVGRFEPYQYVEHTANGDPRIEIRSFDGTDLDNPGNITQNNSYPRLGSINFRGYQGGWRRGASIVAYPDSVGTNFVIGSLRFNIGGNITGFNVSDSYMSMTLRGTVFGNGVINADSDAILQFDGTNSSTGYWNGSSRIYTKVKASSFAVQDATTYSFVHNPFQDTTFIRGTVKLFSYGTPATTAAALSKTLTNYGVGFATDGTVTSREIKRDTTIYVDDADYDFSAAITTAQIASRYNRVIFWMTTTAAAGSDSELTLHTPDANLMQVEYLIHSVDEAGGFANVIRFGSNNAVDSTNGLVSSYFPAAGDGIHIRAGLRSAAYKYRYSN